jgi:hypothetical protein
MTKIIDLPLADTVTADDYSVVYQGGKTKKVSATVLSGPPGPAATVAVGTTTTGAPGSSASVTNSGTTSAAVFNFTIPRGDTGATGPTGPTGPAGSGAAVKPDLLLNGNFDVWQRVDVYGTSRTISSAYGNGYYLADKFLTAADASSTGSFTISRQAFTVGQTDVPGEPTYFYRMATSSLANGTNGFTYFAGQRIEDVRTYAGKQITVSFYAKASASAELQITLSQGFGSGGSATVTTPVGRPSLTTSWQLFTYTVTLPSISGKTLGTGNFLYLEIFSAIKGTTATAYGVTALTGLVTGSYDISKIKIEEGASATALFPRPVTQETLLCQRYCYVAKNNGGNVLYANSLIAFSSTRAICTPISLPVALRALPTVSHTGISVYSTGYSFLGTLTTISAYTLAGTTISLDLTIPGGAGVAAGNTLIFGIPIGGWILMEAEL